mmetsp:Transcript_17487/g.28286  ORF Transcript_17487/g.28286 Transcript_17487/m.28286 type:complete len:230 (-) Transcript_17487:35-724(-)
MKYFGAILAITTLQAVGVASGSFFGHGHHMPGFHNGFHRRQPAWHRPQHYRQPAHQEPNARLCAVNPHYPGCQHWQAQQNVKRRQYENHRYGQRHHKVVDEGDRWEIQIESPERNKENVFKFDLDLEAHSLKITDRYVPSRFNQEFRLPVDVVYDDLRVRYDRDTVVVIVNKPVSTTHVGNTNNESSNEPAHVYNDEGLEILPIAVDPIEKNEGAYVGYVDLRGVFHKY